MPITKATASSVAPAAKGDLVVGSATNDAAVLGVGTNNQVLTADSSTATGLKWATASSGGMTLLSTTSLSGTSVTVSSIPQTYNHLFIEIYGVTWDTGESAFSFNTNLTSALSWLSILPGAVTFTAPNTNVSPINDGSQNAKRTGANNYYNLTFYNYASSTDYKTWQLNGCFEGHDAGWPGRLINFAGGANSDTAIDSFTWKTTSGHNMTAGTIKVYGVN